MRCLCLLLLVGFATHSVLGQDLPEFDHSEEAKSLIKKYESAIVGARKQSSAEIEEVERNLAGKLADLKDKLLVELQRVQDAETKNANLDAAVEVRDAIERLKRSEKVLPLEPMELREKLAGTVWVHTESQPVIDSGENWFRLNRNGTITTGWHDLGTMWAVLPDNRVQMIFTRKRIVRIMDLSDDYQTGQIGTNWFAKRR